MNYIKIKGKNTKKFITSCFTTFYHYICSQSYLALLYLYGGNTTQYVVCYCASLSKSTFPI